VIGIVVAKWGGGLGQTSRSQVFCSQKQWTFRQLANVQFSPNLATTRESMCPRKVSEGIFENFPFTEGEKVLSKLLL